MILFGHEKMSTEFWPLQKQKILPVTEIQYGQMQL